MIINDYENLRSFASQETEVFRHKITFVILLTT